MQTALGILVFVGVSLSAFRVGLQADRSSLHRLRTHPAILTRFFIATFVVMPALAVALSFTSTPKAVWAGLALISMTPPGIGLSQKSLKLKGDPDLSFAWQALALAMSIVTIPITLIIVQMALHLQFDLAIKQVFLKILVFYLLPTILGFTLTQLAPHHGKTALRIAKPISTVVMLLLVALVLVIAVVKLLTMSAVALLSVLAFVACAIFIGHLMGGPPEDCRPVLATALALRWPAPALVLANENGWTQQVLPIILAYLLGGVVLMAIYGRWQNRHAPLPSVEAPGLRPHAGPA
jgi:predicted Na+-dependent transporter